MKIRDRIFARISELDITQKEFAKRTGIPETTVSDWKKKKTNPTGYYGAAKPPVRQWRSHLSGLTEPPGY